MERPKCCTSTWVEEPCTLFHGYRGSGQVLGYDILCFPGLGVVDWLQALRRNWATALKPQHVFLHGEGHSQSVLPGLAKPTIVSEEHHAAASCTHVDCYGTATSLEWADLLSATSILGHGCSVHCWKLFRCYRTERKNSLVHKPCHWCDIEQDNGWLR